MGMSTQTEIAFPAPSPAYRETPAAGRLELLAYTADQVCAALQISKVTLWRLEKRGLLQPLPYLRHKRYSVAAMRILTERVHLKLDDRR